MIDPRRFLFLAMLIVSCSLANSLFAAPASKCGGAPLKGTPQLPGSKLRVEASGVTIWIPAGWQSSMARGADGAPYVLLKTPLVGPNGMIVLAASDAVSEPLTQRAASEAAVLAGGVPPPQAPARNISVGEHCGAQVVAQVGELEVYVTLIRVGGRTYAVEARYAKANASTVRKNLDTLVATTSFPVPTTEATPPPETQEQDAQSVAALQGCWSATLDTHSSLTLVLYADGTYRRTYTVIMPEAVVEPKIQIGRYTVSSGSLRMVTNTGESNVYAFTLNEGVLRLGNTRYIGCD